MRTKHLMALCAGLAGAAFGCSDGSMHASDPTAAADGPPAGSPAAPPVPTATTAAVRVAHLAPGEPAIDVCIAVHGTGDFAGPLLKSAGVDAAGLAYAQATKYLALATGQYDFRVVAGAATSCASGRIDATDVPELRPFQSVTIALLGAPHASTANAAAVGLVAYADDASTAPGPVGLRFIHASPDTASVDAGFGSGNQFTTMFPNVAYAAVGRSGASDVNGYAMIPPPQAPLLTVRLRGATDDALTFTPPMLLSRGDAVTAFLVGNLAGTPAPLKALVCFDNGTGAGALAACAVRP